MKMRTECGYDALMAGMTATVQINPQPVNAA
jgi:hypothetical protein